MTESLLTTRDKTLKMFHKTLERKTQSRNAAQAIAWMCLCTYRNLKDGRDLYRTYSAVFGCASIFHDIFWIFVQFPRWNDLILSKSEQRKNMRKICFFFLLGICTVETLAFFANEPKNAIIKSIRNLMRAFIKIEMWSIGWLDGRWGTWASTFQITHLNNWFIWRFSGFFNTAAAAAAVIVDFFGWHFAVRFSPFSWY